MKKAVILHGTDGSPEENWFPWLKSELEKRDYEVWVPNMPNNHTPNRQAYNDFLLNSGWDFSDNLVLGHSSGAVSVLNMLMDERCPNIKAGILAAAWADSATAKLDQGGLTVEQFKDLFPPGGFNFETIKQKAGRLLFLHGDNDPFCPLGQAQWLAEQTGSDIIVVPGGGHLGSKFPEFPQLVSALEARHLL